MNHPLHLDRRDFLAASTAAGVGLLTAGRAQAAEFKTKLYKSMTLGAPTEGLLRRQKEAGFDGMETNAWKVSPDQAAKSRETAEKIGIKLHSVLYGWADFDAPDESAVAKYVADVQTALRACEGYGASALLLVPCQGPPVKGDEIPKPWDFDIELDESTGHVTRVVEGDNSKYAAYIKAQNLATDASRRVIEEKLIPVAEKTGVIIALENVWNHLWVKPKLFANLVASFKNRWVKAYFDIGNHVRYAMPEEWIRALGNLTVKYHVKDFKLDPTHTNPQGGTFVHPRDGSINWPLVREEIDKTGYNGFLTIEDGGLSLAEFSRRLDLIIAGK
jgi:L-ribulose-5-phosphate 3-epimerase